MLGFIKSVFSSGVMGSVERIASEAIETQKETAEAKSLFIKTLDPNGIMRRELSRFACVMYGLFLTTALILIVLSSFGVGDVVGSKEALGAITELFMPITTAWGAIVSASFGVNYTNAKKGQ